MVFSYVSLIDPLNCQQTLTRQQAGVFTDENYQHNPQFSPSPSDGGVGGSRSDSLTERVRLLSNIQKADKALRCPRCESTNTKFCYFNNYSLSQPRHFCKSCRRYWTRGGSLRNVPVGGGCRRNKSRKRTKSPSSVFASNRCSHSDHMFHSGQMNPVPPQLPPLHPSHHPADYISGDNVINSEGTRTGNYMEFQIENSSTDGGSLVLEPWRVLEQVQQFPYPTELYPFESEVGEAPSYGGRHQFGSIFS